MKINLGVFMEYYCPQCGRKYENLSFKYCPLCNVRIEVRPKVYEQEITVLNEEIEILKNSIKEYEDKLSTAITDDEINTFNLKLENLNNDLNSINMQLDSYVHKRNNLSDDDLRDELYRRINLNISHEDLNAVEPIAKMLNYSDRKGMINLIVDKEFSQDLQEGSGLLNKGKYLEALKYLDKAVYRCKTEIAWIFKAECYNNLNDYKNVIQCCDEAIKIHPDCIQAWNFKSSAHYMLHNYKGAIDDLNHVVNLDNKNFIAWNIKSELEFIINDYVNALESCKIAINLKNKDPQLWARKGNCYYHLHEKEDALRCYEESLKINPNNPEVLEMVKLLKEE